ncbi:MAG: hypothetical protein M0Z59_09135 [Nitrospiraceae bacterium]|nr:hypothetical protein [Nitrospiraceae bacterium]
MPKAGEKPGKGTYECSGCGEEQNLNRDVEKLKECLCGGTEFKKKGKKATVKK